VGGRGAGRKKAENGGPLPPPHFLPPPFVFIFIFTKIKIKTKGKGKDKNCKGWGAGEID